MAHLHHECTIMSLKDAPGQGEPSHANKSPAGNRSSSREEMRACSQEAFPLDIAFNFFKSLNGSTRTTYRTVSQAKQAQNNKIVTTQERIYHMFPCQVSDILGSAGKLAICKSSFI